jgi:Fic family protein
MFEDKITFDFKTMQTILNKIAFIDSFKGKWEMIEKTKNTYLKELKRIATIQSIGSSTRIEGATMSDKDIEELIDKLTIINFETRDEQEVIGYYNVLEIIFDNFKSLNLSENYIKQLHGILLEVSEKDSRHRGSYKKLANRVVTHYPDGTQQILFNTTDPYLVEKKMGELLNWINKKFLDTSIHPLIITGLFTYEFSSIHPFQDGNGRLSRLLTTLLLLRAGYNFIQYISFEHIIEQKKKDYYKALMTGQKNRYKKNERIDQWMLFFLDCIEILIKKLEVKYNIYKNKGGYLNKRQQKLKDFIKQQQPVKISDILENLPGYPKSTLKKDLRYLCDENILEKIGKAKATIYLIKE